MEAKDSDIALTSPAVFFKRHIRCVGLHTNVRKTKQNEWKPIVISNMRTDKSKRWGEKLNSYSGLDISSYSVFKYIYACVSVLYTYIYIYIYIEIGIYKINMSTHTHRHVILNISTVKK